MKRQAAPVTWPVERKGSKFIVRPNPGKSFKLSVPVGIVFKDMLSYCKTTKEVKNILLDKEVMIDGKRRKDHRYTVGVMDVISIPVSGENYRMMINTDGKLELLAVPKEESQIKPYKITKITILPGAKVQLNLNGGTNITVPKNDYKVNDTLVLKGKDIEKHIRLEKGSYAILLGGKHIGSHGQITNIDGNKVEIEATGMGKMLTDKKHVFVVGGEKPLIKLTD